MQRPAHAAVRAVRSLSCDCRQPGWSRKGRWMVNRSGRSPTRRESGSFRTGTTTSVSGRPQERSTANAAMGLAVAVSAVDHSRLSFVVRDFWQMYPGGLAVKKDGIHVQLLPPLPKDTYDDPDSRKWFSQIYPWFKDGNYPMHAGQLTRHEFFVRRDPPGSTVDPVQWAAWAANPIVPQLPADYLCGTGVLGRGSSRGPRAFGTNIPSASTPVTSRTSMIAAETAFTAG